MNNNKPRQYGAEGAFDDVHTKIATPRPDAQ